MRRRQPIAQSAGSQAVSRGRRFAPPNGLSCAPKRPPSPPHAGRLASPLGSPLPAARRKGAARAEIPLHPAYLPSVQPLSRLFAPGQCAEPIFLVTFARKGNLLRINRLVGLLENWVTR